MREMQGPARGRDDADTGSPFRITPLLVRFDDKERERRFAGQQLGAQAAVIRGVALVMLALVCAQWLIAGRLGEPSMTTSDAVTLVVTAGVLAVTILGLLLARSQIATASWIAVASLVLPAGAGALIAAGTTIAAQPIVLVAGGAVIVYFTARTDVLWTAMAAVFYSAVTVPVWLAVSSEADRATVVYTLAATAVAHVAGMAEARQRQRALREAFAQREDLRQLSAIDVLTGLANRRAFDERLDSVWTTWQSTGRTPSVLMLDIDHFKKLNDSLGHAAGDVALRMVADAIRGSLRKGSDHLVARYGGEEFVILLPNEEHQVVHAIAERVVAAVRGSGVDRAVVPRGVERPAGLPPLTVSVGIAMARASMRRAAELVDAADRALYRAKREGRDCVRCDDDAETAASMRPF